MVPKDQKFTNLKVDEVLVVGKQLVVPRIQSAELVVTSSSSGKIKDLTVDDLTILNTMILPTPGGTASSLNFYQEFSGTVDFTSTAFNGTQTVAVKLTRIGNKVTMLLSGFEAANNTLAGTIDAAAGSIPAQFRPSESITLPMMVIFNAGVGASICAGLLGVGSDGSMTVTLNQSITISGVTVMLGTPFPAVATANFGFPSYAGSWLAA